MITSTPESPIKTPLKVLIMGPPGSRKTTLGLQFPDVHVLDCDNNLMGPERWLRSNGHKDLKYTLDSIRYEDDGKPVEIEECYLRVLDKLKLFSIDDAYRCRKTVFLDSLSHVNEFIIRHVLKLQQKSKKTYEMEARDWSPFKSFAYILLVSKLEQTGKAVICSCHETKIFEPPAKDNMMVERVIGYEPMFQGKVGETIGAFFTDVWRCEVRPGPAMTSETWLQTDKTPRVDLLKNSLGLPAELNITKGFSVLEPYLKGRI